MKTYGYDDLDRLTSADMSVNSVSTYQRDFTYDQYGCIQQVTDNGTTISSYGYSLTPFHAPVSYNNESLDYDANGNLVEDEDFIYVYNDANQLSEVRYSSNSSLVEKYWYDANGQRVKKQNSVGEFSYYVNQFYEIENGTATSYFFRDDERIAKQTDEGMEWYLSDHLGSTTLLVNESGLEVERTEYYPYGEVQSGGLEKYGFTGQENDVDTELMYYGARYYSPEYRVFVQPDTMLPDVYNPQALNRYSYCLNNPVKYVDPSGHVVTPWDVLDVASFIDSSYSLYNDPSLVNLGFFAWDFIALLPVVPSSATTKIAIKGYKIINKGDSAVKGVVTKADDLPFDIIITKDGKRYLEDGTAIRNGHLAGKTHSTGVTFDSNGFPVFDSAFDATIDPSMYKKSNDIQFEEANLQLSEAIKNDPSVGNKFTREQLQQISQGETPDGYLWHHHQDEGRLQLVDANIHSKTGHTGGQKIWGGGNENR